MKPKGSYTLTALLEHSEVSLESEETQTALEPKLTESYSREEFEIAWKDFMEVLNKRGEISLFSTLSVRIPMVTADHSIQVDISNNVQESDVVTVRAEMLEFLKARLKNHLLNLQIIIKKDESQNTRLYTDKDKFDAMVGINPALEGFRTNLNLDLEF